MQRRFTALGYRRQQLGDDAVGGDAFGFGLVVQDQTVAQRRQRDAPHVVEGDVDPAGQDRVDLAAHDHRLGGARAGAEAHVASRGLGRLPAARGGWPAPVARRSRRRGWPAGSRGRAPAARARASPSATAVGGSARGPVVRSTIAAQLGARREADVQLEEEAVELRLGQRVGALHLDRVLRGQDEERSRQRVADRADGHGLLLHGFEQRRLGLGRGAVDLVGQHEVGEDRPGLELEARARRGRFRAARWCPGCRPASGRA